jgi:undecaprenyl pyrophosphate synthase
MRPVGEIGCDEKKVSMADVYTREDMSLKSKQEKKRERERERERVCVCVCVGEGWRESHVVGTEATVVRGGLQDQD